MNRFRARRKAKEEAAAAKHAAEAESTTPFKLFSKGKKSHEEPEKKIDLSSVLPPTDDFRTSLLMTGLSARFSMLREQDDPNSKIGKASDDSVILSNRQSRGPDLNFGNLGDIAEVESVRAPQSLRRMNSFTSSSDADAAGVMGRGRPTEGNVLFGGRQKVYKVSSATASGGPGGMGKVMYEDDVTISSFQKWRQAEKENERQRLSLADQDEENPPSGPSPRASELEALRPESPPSYNRKRETASTTSSAPSASRNSTAATSVTSQKDWHHPGSSATSPTPIMEKTVARTRRLYEQGLTQELQNNQSHALSRIDTLTRRGPARTPDMSQNSSPTANHFGERAADRKLLAKASAPNMQTASPRTAPRSATSPTDLSGRTSRSSETRPFGTAPLSPPISEHDESPTLPIQAGDRGKATAMGVFQKPNKPYDESRFAQRQMQLQQGRETPTQPSRPASDAEPEPPKIPSIDTTAPSTESPAPTKSMTFLDDDEDTLPQMHPSRPVPTCQPGQVRPADEDHPAFRSSALPTPLTFVSQSSDDAQTHLTTPDTADSQSAGQPKDSPTLGPPAGLSGMVRQHLRSDSGASSVYGIEPQPPSTAPKHHMDTFDSKALDELVSELNPWAAQDQEWRASFYTGNAQQGGTESPAAAPREQAPMSQPVSSRQSTASSDVGKEKDAFHSQLADGARRVRERLTTYVESDGGSDRDVASTPDASLRPKLLRNQSSRVSLADRARDGTPSRAIKKLGLSNATMTSSPSPNKQSFDEKEQPLAPMEEEPSPERESPKSSGEEKPDGGIHAGLRQFRNARRELQRLKEAEAGQRHRSSSGAAQSEAANGGSPASHGSQPRHVRSPSRERRPPPVSYSRPASTEPWAGPGSNPGSRAGSRAGSRPPSRNDRDRSGSETSNNGGRSQSRPPPPRLRKGPPPPEEYQQGPQHGPYAQHRHTQGPPRQGMLRSPGLPGTDVRRSPIVPPQPFPGNPEGLASQKAGLSPYQQGRGPSGQSSPISPMGDLPSPYGAPSRATLSGAPPRPSGAPPPVPDATPTVRLDDSMKRAIRKKDISEPTFVSSTSRVPTVNLPDDGSRSRSRSRSGSLLRSGAATASTPNLHSIHHAQADAPPVPPINPRRRVLGLGRGESDDGVYPGAMEGGSFSLSDEEEGGRRRLRNGEGLGRERAGTGMGARPSVYGAGNPPAIRDNGMPGGLI